MDSKKGTKEAPADIHPTGTFSAFSVRHSLLQSSRLVTTLAMATTISAVTKEDENSSAFLQDIFNTYTEYDDAKETANDKLPLFNVNVSEEDPNDRSKDPNEGGASTSKKTKFMRDVARDELIGTITDFQTASVTDISEAFKAKLSERILTICEAITFGKHETIQDAKGLLQEKITLPREFRSNQLAAFIQTMIDLSNGQLKMVSRITKEVVQKCLSYVDKKTKVKTVPTDYEHESQRYMLLIPARVFIHLHKFFFKGRGQSELIEDPPVWVHRLEDMLSIIQGSADWISTLCNTKQTIHKISHPQQVFICDRDFLAAMGVTREYKSKLTKELLNKTMGKKGKHASPNNGDDETTKPRAQTKKKKKRKAVSDEGADKTTKSQALTKKKKKKVDETTKPQAQTSDTE